MPAGKCACNNISFYFALVVGILLLFCNRVTARAAYYTRRNVYTNIIIYEFFFYMTITLTQFVASRLLFYYFFFVKILFGEKI